ncbi:MAG TPA: MATE family efflux transporter [Candidatus Faecalibacterium faecipullorum]|uniref:MATE family efflux transporter n=1 Tax=Candidatus Faecalibacterium faecipullorum TaxID=2838578 RepID=A0A9D2MDS2_9FIRM|nr:MATE family efflux transporter [Candidatus Faecalibacterium faecipullorum]
MNKDLTVGKPSTVLWQFCLPMFGSIVFQQLYNIADSLVAGKFVGESALAAVGNSYEITLIFIAFAFGCNIGCSVVVSRFFGARQYRDMKTAVTTSLIGCAVLVALLMAAGLAGCDALLALINTPAEIMADSALYLDIYVLGLPFMFFYNVATGIFSALGDSKTPFLFLAASSVSNIFMDILFVTAFDMGVAGVAWATFLCQGASCVLALWAVARRMRSIPTEGRPVLFSWRMLGKIAVIAVPSILQQSSVSVGNIIIQSVINGFGTGVMAGYSASVKLNNLVITSFTTLANGISNYTSQNLGAAKPERVRQGYAAGVKLVWLICIPLAGAYFFAGRQLLYLFMSEPSAAALDTGILFLRIVAPFYFVVSVKLVSDGVLRGCANMVQFMVSTFADLILRVVLSVALSSTALGSTGIWLSWPIGWAVGTGLSLLFCLRAVGAVRRADPDLSRNFMDEIC